MNPLRKIIARIPAQIRFILVLAFPICLYFIPVSWLNQQHSICLFKNIFGIECWGCGITRAVLSAIQLDFVVAYHYNKLIIIVFPLLLFVWIRMLVKSLSAS